MVLALLVTLLSGWLVLSLAQKAQSQSAVAPVTKTVTTPSASSSSPVNTSGVAETQVDINSGAKTQVEIKP